MIKTKEFNVERREGDNPEDNPVLVLPVRATELKSGGLYHARSITKKLDSSDKYDVIASIFHYEFQEPILHEETATVIVNRDYHLSITAHDKTIDRVRRSLESFLRRKVTEKISLDGAK